MKSDQSLSRQFILIFILIFIVIGISLGLLIPKALLPVYENNIYQYLKQPLEIIQDDSNYEKIDTDVAYLYIVTDGQTLVSSNLKEIIDASSEQILKEIDKDCGKFRYKGETYYYNTNREEYVTKIALTNSQYLTSIRTDILKTMFPSLLITLIVCIGLVLGWSSLIVRKIEHLKNKVDNLDNDEFIDNHKFELDDELKSLSIAIDEMKTTLKIQEEYKTQMYQNISHDFKTPLTVIKSYIEGIEDEIQSPEEGLKIIKEEVDKLEIKVHSLLYLNKLNYIKDLKDYNHEKTDVSKIIEKSINKFKMSRQDVEWKLNIDDKKTIFTGSEDMWEAIVDNLLNNFTRYAEKSITVTIKNNKITFYNDGPNIDPNILSNIFTPYKKGIKGQFGLGLSIVKKTIALCGYEVIVHNEKKGVSFIIK